MLGSGLRRLDGEALGGFRRPAQARHGLAGGFDTRTIGSSKRPRCSLRRGWFPSPPPRFSDRKIAAQLFRRCPRPVGARIMPDSFVSSIAAPETDLLGYP